MPQENEAFRPPAALQEAYDRRHMALGLGAGVSQASLVPSWIDLLLRLAEALPHIGRHSAQALLDAGYEPPVLATILRSKVETDAEFAELVRKALYRDFAFKAHLDEHNHTQFVAQIRDTNPTLHAVGGLCGVKAGDRTFEPNPRVRAVVTFNIDALMEMYTRARFQRRVLRTVERAAASASGDKIHSYHLHGYLVNTFSSKTRFRAAVESADRLIFTEQQYFDVVANANGFVNYTLLHQLREHVFLFVGLSMRDANLRRALHFSFKERIRELIAEGKSESDAVKRSSRHWAIMMKHSAEIDAATATLLNVIGVKPLWITAWSDIPSLLKTLYEGTGEYSWSDVE